MCIIQDQTPKTSRRRPLDSGNNSVSIIENIMDLDNSIKEDVKSPERKSTGKKLSSTSSTATATTCSIRTTSTRSTTKSSIRSNNSTHSRRESVAFHREVTIREVLHMNNFTDEELSQTWYQPNEYTAIKRSVLKNLTMLKSGLFEDSENTARGLEKYTPTGGIKESMRRRREDAIWSVLDEQDLQVETAEKQQLTYLIYDDEAIREVYKKHTRPSTDVARCAARLDAQAANSNSSSNQRRTSSSSLPSSSTAKKRAIKNLFSSTRRMCAPDSSPGAAPPFSSAA